MLFICPYYWCRVLIPQFYCLTSFKDIKYFMFVQLKNVNSTISTLKVKNVLKLFLGNNKKSCDFFICNCKTVDLVIRMTLSTIILKILA